MISNNRALFFLFTTLLYACSTEEITPREYPRVRTLEVTNISSAGATVSGEVYFSSVPILDVGILVSQYSSALFEDSDQVSLGPKPATGSFIASIDITLTASKSYYARAYALSDGHIVYGNIIKFSTP